MTPIARIRDTLPAFEAYARKAGLESPMRRELLWKDSYRAANVDVFKGFDDATLGATDGMSALVRDLSAVRARVQEAAPVVTRMIEEVDPKLGELLGLPPEPSPIHVLMVGAFTTNSAVGRLHDDVAVFHCLEWFQSPEGTKVLIAHEGSHGWHEIALERRDEQAPVDDMAWMVFTEGMATQVSRAAVPGMEEIDYFWYGHPEAQGWLPWCQQHLQELGKHVRASLDIPEAIDTFFGGGLVDGKWRVGYYLADSVVGGLGRTLPELAAMSVDDARLAVRDALARF
ncbi:MAG TPA: hypothetical protein VHT97_05910 [Acidimicrobiales bacterium]|jgi:hypothetical protein|nr:hypothetical protein [Acidimicrobiales bacterium]